MKHIILPDTGYQLGLNHGTQLRHEIRELLSILHTILSNPHKKPLRRGLLGRMYRRSVGVVSMRWLRRMAGRLLHSIPQHYIQEMQGIADGAGVRFIDILVINTYDDLLYLAGCSSICVLTEDQNILHGRNLDYYYPELLGKDIFMTYKDLGFVSIGFPGYIGCLTATNQYGLSLSAHTSICHQPARGLPTGLMYRTIMQYAETLDQARDILTHLPKTVGNNLLISSSHEHHALVAEISSQGVEFRELTDDKLRCTNHYISPSLISQQKKATIGSLKRHRYIQQQLSLQLPQSVDQLKKLLCHDDGNRDSRTSVANGGTIQSVVFDPNNHALYYASHDQIPVCAGVWTREEVFGNNAS